MTRVTIEVDMKTRDLINLLNRAAAAIETPNDLNEAEIIELIEDLIAVADAMEMTQ